MAEVLALIAWPVAAVLLFAIAMGLAAGLGFMPSPRPALDVDRTILVHQADAARMDQAVDLVLIGDSSCLMNVSASTLGEQLSKRVLNLGTLSYLDLNSYGELLSAAATANRRTLQTVVLLMHPEALRRTTPEPSYENLLRSYLQREDSPAGAKSYERTAHLLGLETFRTRIWSRMPIPLPGAFGQEYGFTHDLERALTRNSGSAADPDQRPFEGDADYRLAPQLEKASQLFRQRVPAGLQLLVGITPAPEGFVRPAYRSKVYPRMLSQWSTWLRADAALTNLPPTMPDGCFAKVTHLNRQGIAQYTKVIAESLQSQLPRGPARRGSDAVRP
jgi:hypothetical protein